MSKTQIYTAKPERKGCTATMKCGKCGELADADAEVRRVMVRKMPSDRHFTEITFTCMAGHRNRIVI